MAVGQHHSISSFGNLGDRVKPQQTGTTFNFGGQKRNSYDQAVCSQVVDFFLSVWAATESRVGLWSNAPLTNWTILRNQSNTTFYIVVVEME